jgi:hypothetical protein
MEAGFELRQLQVFKQMVENGKLVPKTRLDQSRSSLSSLIERAILPLRAEVFQLAEINSIRLDISSAQTHILVAIFKNCSRRG